MTDANVPGGAGRGAGPTRGDNPRARPNASAPDDARAPDYPPPPGWTGRAIWSTMVRWPAAWAGARRQIAVGGQRARQALRAAPLAGSGTRARRALPWARSGADQAWRSAQRTSYSAALNDLGPSYSAARRWSPLWLPVVLEALLLALALLLHAHPLGRLAVSSAQIKTLAIVLLIVGVAFGALLRLATNDTVWTAVAALGLASYLMVTALVLAGPLAALVVALLLAVAGAGLVRQRLHPVMEGTVDVTTVFGKYNRTLLPGLNVLLPGERVLAVLNTRPRHYTSPPQRVRTASGQEAQAMAAIAYQLVPEEAHRAVTLARDWERNLQRMLAATLQDELARWRPDATDDPPADTSGQEPAPTDALRLAARVERRMRDQLLRWGVRVAGVQLSNVDLPSGASQPAPGSARPSGPPIIVEGSLAPRPARDPRALPPLIAPVPKPPSPVVTVTVPASPAAARPAAVYPIPPLPTASNPPSSRPTPPSPAPSRPVPATTAPPDPAPTHPTTAFPPPRPAFRGAPGVLGRELARFARPGRATPPPVWPGGDPAGTRADDTGADDKDDDTGTGGAPRLLGRLASFATGWRATRADAGQDDEDNEDDDARSSRPRTPQASTPQSAPAPRRPVASGASIPRDTGAPAVPSPAVLAAMYDEIREGHISDPQTVRGIAEAFGHFAQDGDADPDFAMDAGEAARALMAYAQELANQHGLSASPAPDDQGDSSATPPVAQRGAIHQVERDENLTAGG